MKSEWNRIKLGDAVLFNPTEKITKGTISKKVAMDKLTPFSRHIDGFDITEYNGGSKFRNGDTLLARITPCLENGKTAQVSILDDNEIGFGSTEFIVLREKTGVSNRDYIYYLAIDNEFRDKAIKSMVGSSGRQRVQQDILEKMDISLPPLSEQKAIAETLSCLDDKIELNNRINKNLEAQAQAIFKSWFVDFEPFQNGEFIDSELGKIPKGWKVGTAADLGDIVGGSTPSKAKPEYYTDKGIAWLTPKDLSIQKNKFIFHGETDITELGLKNSSARLMPKGTVLFSSRAPIGYIAIAGNEVSTNQGFKSIVPFSYIGTPYVYFYLKTNLERIESSASGSTFREVSGSTMKNIPALIPCNNALIQFTQLCDTIFLQQQKLEQQNQALAALRDTLLPKLMSGEIEIPQEV